MKKIFNYIMLFAVALSGLTLTACSEDELDTNQYNKSGVNILAFGPMPITRGETMRLTGTQLDQVKEVLFPEGNQKLTTATTYIQGDFDRANSEEMTVTIPDLCVPGKLRLVTNSNDTIVSSSNITFVEEIKVSGATPQSVHAGDIISIKGEYVWNIAEVTFTAGVKVAAENFIKNTRNEVQVLVPRDAISGPLTYNDGSEGAEDITICNLTVDVATATSLSNATPEFGEVITIYGENLDLVSQVDFPSVQKVEFSVADDGKSISVTVPAASTTGDIVLTSYSGLTTSVAVAVPLITYHAGSIYPTDELKKGDKVTLQGTLLDRVTQVVLPGDITLEKGQFEQSATQISFTVPEGMGDGKVKLVQHANYSIETDKIAMHHDGAEKVIWSGNFKIDGWNGCQDLAWGGYDWSALKAGDEIIFYVDFVNPDDGWACLSPRMGKDWGSLSVSQIDFTPSKETQRAVLKLTESDVDNIKNNGGLVITGTGIILKQVAMPIPQIVAWSGTFTIDGWNGCQDLAWGAYDWSTFQAGQKIIFTVGFVNPADGWACLSPRMGKDWGNLSVSQIDFAPSAEDQVTTFIPTSDDINNLKNNGGLVITGTGIILKQVVIQ